jgi:tRNA threonylcarbamoyladenosine biosynthesis protein TsaE
MKIAEHKIFAPGPLCAEELKPVLDFITDHIDLNSRTLIRLHGELGAGKTFLVSKILHAMGLNERVPVQSPTFALVHQYSFGPVRAAHLDLYRLNQAQDLAEVTGADFDSFNLVFVEWSDRMSGGFEPDTTLDVYIRHGSNPNSRNYEVVIFEGKKNDGI